MSTDITKTNWEYPHMDPNDEIFGLKGLCKAMPALYGPNFDSSRYNALFNNIRTGALMSKAHHCTHLDTQGHKMTRSCAVDGHQAYCLEWVTEGGRRVRCGVRFKVVSGGCGTHPSYSMESSNNLLIKNLQAGRIPSISWSLLNDRERVSNSSDHHVDTQRLANQAILARCDKELAAMDNIGALAMGNYNVHIAFEEKKVQRERAEQEQRKIQANEKRSRVTSKSKKKKSFEDVGDVPPIPEIPRRFGKSKFVKRGGKNA